MVNKDTAHAPTRVEWSGNHDNDASGSAAETALSQGAGGKAPAASWRALIVLLIGMGMALLDTTVVNVALPSIRTSLSASESTLSWVISGYALAFGLALIPAGRIGDRVGHKWIFFAGLALFTAGSVACGLASNETQLVIFRVVQGLAGGTFVPAVTAYIQLLFPGRQRGKAFGIMGAVIGISTAIGPVLAGVLIQAFGDTSGWRYVFAINLPIGLVALILAAFWIPGHRVEPSPRPRSGIDTVGFGLLTIGLIGILLPLIDGQQENWPTWTFVSLAAGVILVIAFFLWEVRYARTGGTPLIDPKLFRSAAFSAGTILALVYFAAFTSIFFSISLLWQAGLGNSALASGLVAIPFALGTIVGASQSDKLAARLGRSVLAIGTAAVTVGLVALCLMVGLIPGRDLTWYDLAAPFLIAGLGNGFFIAPNTQFIVAAVDRRDAGSASGVIAMAQRVGSAIGIAAIGSVLFAAANLDEVHGAQDRIDAYSRAASSALGLSAAFSLLAFLLVFALPKTLRR